MDSSIEFSEVERVPLRGGRSELYDDPVKFAAFKAERIQTLPLLRSDFSRRIQTFNTLDLLWHANWREIVRNHQRTNIETSNIAGQLRYLRTLLLGYPLVDNQQIPTVADFDELINELDNLWGCEFDVRMLGVLSHPKGSNAERRRDAAAFMACIQAHETEVAHSDHTWKRLIRILSPFDEEIIEPALGGGAASVRLAISRVLRLMHNQLEIGRKAVGLHHVTGLPPVPSSIDPNPESNPGSVFCFTEAQLAAAIRPLELAAFLSHFATAFGSTPVDSVHPMEDPVVRKRPFVSFA
jgi:hypothetical protein